MKNINKIRLVIAIMTALISITNVKAQLLDSTDFSFQVRLIVDANSIQGTDTSYFHEIHIDLNDTINVSKISVKIGTSLGASDVENYDFVYDVNTFLPHGYSYYREGDLLTLTLDKHAAGIYYYEVKLIDINASETNPKKWNTWDQ